MIRSPLARLTLALITAAALSSTAYADGLRLADPPPPADPPAAPAPEVEAPSSTRGAPPLRFGERSARPAPSETAQSGDGDFTVSCFGGGGGVNDLIGLEMGIRAGSFIASDDWITDESGALYGGLGFTFRWRFIEVLGLDFAFDVLGRGSESGTISETRVNGNLGVSYFFWPDSWLQFYVSGGLSFNDTYLTFDGPVSFDGSYQEYGAYTGFGMEIVLDDWRIDSEMRIHTLGRDDDFVYPDNSPYYREAPDFRIAAQWFLGVSYQLF